MEGQLTFKCMRFLYEGPSLTDLRSLALVTHFSTSKCCPNPSVPLSKYKICENEACQWRRVNASNIFINLWLMALIKIDGYTCKNTQTIVFACGQINYSWWMNLAVALPFSGCRRQELRSFSIVNGWMCMLKYWHSQDISKVIEPLVAVIIECNLQVFSYLPNICNGWL